MIKKFKKAICYLMHWKHDYYPCTSIRTYTSPSGKLKEVFRIYKFVCKRCDNIKEIDIENITKECKDD